MLILNATPYRLLLGTVLILALFSCKNKQAGQENNPTVLPETSRTTVPAVVPLNEAEILQDSGKRILIALRDKAFIRFSDFFHPVKGVRFTPYAYIDTVHDIRLTKSQFISLVQKNEKLLWGTMDGSGDPIKTNFAGYYRKFIYDKDFIAAPQINYNKTVSIGNSLNNQQAIYPSYPFMEYYFPGDIKKYEGMDWRALRLVFEKYEGRLYLVAVIHDEWTT